jgi:hypothetical protein
VGKRRFAIVTHRDERTHGNRLLSGPKVHIQIKGGERDRLTLGIIRHRRFCLSRYCTPNFSGRLPVFIR